MRSDVRRLTSALTKECAIVISTILLLFITNVKSISYRCENNQILIVQSFGNNTIRMHCQQPDLCGNKKLHCNYDHEQRTCGGKNNFVAHVHQESPTVPVNHTCCELRGEDDSRAVPGHDGNDCMVYELPDGSSATHTAALVAHDTYTQHASGVSTARRRRIHSIASNNDDEYTVLRNAGQIPEQFDGYVGYRMKLFLLKKKSPPTLVVKAIERVADGYFITICRPRCGRFNRESDIVAVEEKTIERPDEWAAASWSSWTSSTWTTWSTTTWNGTDEVSARGNASRTEYRESPSQNANGDNAEIGGGNASASASANVSATIFNAAGASNGASVPASGIQNTGNTNNIYINATGGNSSGGGHSLGVGGANRANAVGIVSGSKSATSILEGDGEETDKDNDADLLAASKKADNFEPANNGGNKKNGKYNKKNGSDSENNGKRNKSNDDRNNNGDYDDGDDDGDDDHHDDHDDDHDDDYDDEDVANDNGGAEKEKLEKKGKGKGKVKKTEKGKNNKNAQKNKKSKDKNELSENGTLSGKETENHGKIIPDKSGKLTDEHDPTDNDVTDEPSNGNDDDSAKDIKNIKSGKDKKKGKKHKPKGKGGKSDQDADEDDESEFETSGENENANTSDENVPKRGGKIAGKGKGTGKHGQGKGMKGSEKNGKLGNNGGGGEGKKEGPGLRQVGVNKGNGNDGDKQEGNTSKGDNGNLEGEVIDNGEDNGENDNAAGHPNKKEKVENGKTDDKNNAGGNGKKSIKAIGDKKAKGKNNGKGASEKNEKGGSGKEKEHGNGVEEKGLGGDVEKNEGKEKGKKSGVDKGIGHGKGKGKGKAGNQTGVNGDESGGDIVTSTESNGSTSILVSESEKGDKSLLSTTPESNTTSDGGDNNDGNDDDDDDDKDGNDGDNNEGLGSKKNAAGSNENENDKIAGGDSNKKPEEAYKNGKGHGRETNIGDGDGPENGDKKEKGKRKKGEAGRNNKKPDGDIKKANGKNKENEKDGDNNENGNNGVDEKAINNADGNGKNKVKDKENGKNAVDGRIHNGNGNGDDKKDGNKADPKGIDDENGAGPKRIDAENGKDNNKNEGNNAGAKGQGPEINGNDKNKENGDKAGAGGIDNENDNGSNENDNDGDANGSGEDDGNIDGGGLVTAVPDSSDEADKVDDDGETIVGEGSGEGSGQDATIEGDGEEISVSNKLGGKSGGDDNDGNADKENGNSGESIVPIRGNRVQPAARQLAAPKPASDTRVLSFQDMPNATPEQMQRSCFSADTAVRTISGWKPMDQLEVGDLVLVPASGNLLKFERVEMFYHREPETYVKFIHIETKSGKFLSLTPLHLLPFGDCEMLRNYNLNVLNIEQWMRESRFAHKARAGECVLSIDDTNNQLIVDRIVKVGRRYSKGIYSPMTVEGSLIAGGVLSSCFSQLESHATQKLAYDLIVRIYQIFGYLYDESSYNVAGSVREIPSLLDHVHRFSRYILPFAKY